MATYKRTTGKDGRVRYYKDGKAITEKKLSEDVLAGLQEDGEVDDSGTPLDVENEAAPTAEDTSDADVEDPDEDEETPRSMKAVSEDDLPPMRKSERGMGFPMNSRGQTVDIFDLKTPHTEARFVDGIIVPLSKKSFDTKSDQEIIAQLAKLRKAKKIQV